MKSRLKLRLDQKKLQSSIENLHYKPFGPESQIKQTKIIWFIQLTLPSITLYGLLWKVLRIDQTNLKGSLEGLRYNSLYSSKCSYCTTGY